MVKQYFYKMVKGVITPKSRPDLPYEESGKGLRYSKCSSCKEVFSSPGTFDKHRKVTGRMDNYRRVCLDPETVGLVLGERNVWIAADRDEDEAS